MKARVVPSLFLAWTLAPCCGGAAEVPYNAETTYRKLVRDYPQIRIADEAAPASVQVRRGLVYARRGELALALDLYLPAPDAHGLPAPLVVLVHGGGWASGERATMAPLAARLAARGFAAATVSYRLTGQARYPAAVDYVRDAVLWLRAQADACGVDSARIALAGASAGGQIATLAGLRQPGLVAALVNIDGLSDFTTPEALRHEDDPARKLTPAGAWLGGRHAEVPLVWREALPVTHAGKDSPPLQFIVSAVPRFSAGREAMTARLAAHGILTDTVALPASPHSFWLFDPWVTPTVDAMASFLKRVWP